jgi:hypothetical protein
MWFAPCTRRRGAYVSWFSLKTKVDSFSGLASKPVATVLVVWPQNHSLWFSGLGFKTGSYGLVICPTKSLQQFLGLGLKPSGRRFVDLHLKTDEWMKMV